MTQMPDLSLAVADKYLYQAAMSNFYGSLTFSFKAGRLVMVRREETEIVISPSDTDDRMKSGAHAGDTSGPDYSNGNRSR